MHAFERHRANTRICSVGRAFLARQLCSMLAQVAELICPMLCELVGPSGRVTVLDLAPENVEACRIRLQTLKPQCHAETILGSIQQLPFSEDSFGALWCANTLQYLSNEELFMALTEFKRVTRLGGVVAIKDGDMTCLQIAGIEPTIMWRYLDSARRASQQIAGLMRAIDIPRWFRKAGLVNIRAKTFIIERHAPLDSTNRVALSSLIKFIVQSALDTKPQDTDCEQWHSIHRRLREDKLFDAPEFLIREGAVVVVGEVPS